MTAPIPAFVPIKPKVMSMNDWLAATDLGSTGLIFHQDRKRLKPIDNLLGTWETTGTTAPKDEQCRILGGLVMMCREWIKKKGAKTTDNAVKRRVAVQKLLYQAEARLMYERDPAYSTAYDTYQRNKLSVKSGRTFPGGTISLAQGYTQEHWGKAKGMPRVGATNMGQAMSQIEDKSVKSHIGKITGGTDELKRLTPEQYNKLEAYLLELKGKAFTNSDGEVVCQIRELTYYSKDQRIGHMMVPMNNRFFDVTGLPFSTRDAPDKMYIYAIDSYGNFYAQEGVAGLLHHSSFNRGKGVICAGCIQVSQGIPYYISNESGHYKPTTIALRNAVQLIRSYGIPIDHMWVVDKTQAHHPERIHFPTGTDFLSGRGSPKCPRIDKGNPAMP